MSPFKFPIRIFVHVRVKCDGTKQLCVRLFALLGAQNAHIRKAVEKLRLAQPKTQLFDKSCVLDSGKNNDQNAHFLWTS